MDRPLVVLDTETANLRGAPHLLEIGAVRVVDGEAAGQFSTLVRPEVPIAPETFDVHGISDDDVRDAPPAREALADFFAWIADDWLVAHDAPRDASVLAFEGVRHGLALPDQPFLDTLALAKRLIPESPDHGLTTLAAHLDLDGTPEHRALADAVACWQVLEECLARVPDDVARPVTGPALLTLVRRVTTVAASVPARPRIPRRLRPLETAARDNARLVLHYGEKDEPPVPLPVYPRLLFRLGQKSYLEGECASAGILKTYRLDRIQRVTAEE